VGARSADPGAFEEFARAIMTTDTPRNGPPRAAALKESLCAFLAVRKVRG